jgi:uncharacterized protein YggT (Ycf19 family)
MSSEPINKEFVKQIKKIFIDLLSQDVYLILWVIMYVFLLILISNCLSNWRNKKMNVLKQFKKNFLRKSCYN